MIHGLVKAISSLVCSIDRLGETQSTQTILHRIEQKVNNIMSKISDFAAAQTAFQDRLDTAVAGLTQDVQTLNDKITELQNSSGEITPEDQALLDAIQERSSVIATKLEALDTLTPPPAPPA